MKPTLVMMTKAPLPGRVKTRLAADIGDAEALRVHRLLVERQLRAVPAEWAAEVHFDPPEAEAQMRAWLDPVGAGRPLVFNAQCDGDLGERLGHAMLNAFARRAEAVIFIGGDCPGLTTEILREAGEALQAADVVVAPAEDGGYVLIGLRSHRLGLFNGIAWSTADVLVQTLTKVKEAGLSCVVLGTLEDVDDAAGWARARAEFGLE